MRLYQSRHLDTQDRIEAMHSRIMEKEKENQVLQQKVQFFLDQQEREKAIHQSKVYNLQTQVEFVKAENRAFKQENTLRKTVPKQAEPEIEDGPDRLSHSSANSKIT